MQTYKIKFFVIFIVSVSIIFLTITLYYELQYGHEKEHQQIFLLLMSLFLSSFIGALFFLPSQLKFLQDKDYIFLNAFLNYWIMLIESTIMLLGFNTNENTSFNWYAPYFIIIIYIFFGIYTFSYPRNIKQSFSILSSYILINVLNSIEYSSFNWNTLILQWTSTGYIFLFALICSGILFTIKAWLKNKNIFSKKDPSFKKILIIYFILYSIFILIPGLIYLSPKFINFIHEISTYAIIINLIFFIYHLFIKINQITHAFLESLTNL